MNYGLEALNKIGSPIGALTELFKMLEGPCEKQQFETFRSFTFPEEGIAFSVGHNSELVSIHLYSGGLDGKNQYHRALPFNVAFGDRRIDIARKLGRPPDATGGGQQWEGKEVPNWDRYSLDNALIHFQYSRIDEGVELITIMAKDEVA